MKKIVLLVFCLFLAGMAHPAFAEDTWTLKAELLIKRDTFRIFNTRFYGSGDSEEERARKESEYFKRIGPPKISMDVRINDASIGTVRFGSEKKTESNKDQGESYAEDWIWISKSPTLDITPHLKKPGWLSSSEDNRIRIHDIKISEGPFSSTQLKVWALGQAEKKADAIINGDKDAEFGAPFIRYGIYRNGNLVKETTLLIQVKDYKEQEGGFKYTLKFLNDEFLLTVNK